MNKMNKERLTLKNYSLGILIGIAVMIILGWSQSQFAITYFTNWKMFIVSIAIGFAFSLLMVPFALLSWDNLKNAPKQQHSTKRLLIFTGIGWVVLFAAELLFDYFGGESINTESIISAAIVALFLAVF